MIVVANISCGALAYRSSPHPFTPIIGRLAHASAVTHTPLCSRNIAAEAASKRGGGAAGCKDLSEGGNGAIPVEARCRPRRASQRLMHTHIAVGRPRLGAGRPARFAWSVAGRGRLSSSAEYATSSVRLGSCSAPRWSPTKAPPVPTAGKAVEMAKLPRAPDLDHNTGGTAAAPTPRPTLAPIPGPTTPGPTLGPMPEPTRNQTPGLTPLRHATSADGLGREKCP